MTNGSSEGGMTGGSFSSNPSSVPKSKRLLCSVIDLFGVPVVLGIVFGLILLVIPLPEGVNTVGLIVVNIAWMIVRDTYWSPGRRWTGLKLVSLKGEKVTIQQALIRNVLLIIPGLLLVGYPIEIIAVFFVKGDRIMDGFAKTRVAEA